MFRCCLALFMEPSDDVGPLAVQPTGVVKISTSMLKGTISLPPSKSHAMRWITLASMDSTPTRISMHEVGEDVQALIDSLENFGIIFDEEHIVGGSLSNYSGTVNCKNSGTALRFLMAQLATTNQKITLDGDDSLRVRTCLPLLEALDISYEFLSENHLPISIEGPLKSTKIIVDTSVSSQFLSAILLMTPRTKGFELEMRGKSVSRKHSDLTWDLCKITGAERYGEPWVVKCPDVIIPPDPSMSIFAKLANLEINNPPSDQDLIGHDLESLDLTDSNDFITPMSALLALNQGGVITGAKHATYKESNRISRTKDMLEQFSIFVEETEDGLIIEGGQMPIEPKSVVKTYGDHRIQMTAIILAAMCGGKIEGENLHKVAWPSFLQQLESCGLNFEIEI